MAKADKTSVRAEFQYIQNKFEELKLQNKISSESEMLFRMMISLFEILVSVFMEKKTRKNSDNSSIPKSQKKGDDDTSKKPRSNTKTSEVNFCTHCGEDLKNELCTGLDKRTKIDIFFEKRVLNIEAQIKSCPCCKKETKGWFPEDMKGKLQYGDGIKVFVVNLIVAQMISLNRVQKMLQSLTGKLISEATLLNYLLKFYYALESWEIETKKKILEKKVINCDETSMKNNKKNYWVHVYSSEDLVLKFFHEKRGKEAIDDIGIIPKYGGTIVHDCWASYLSYNDCYHALCGAHLLRELRFIMDSNEYKWAQRMKNLLQITAAKITKRKSKKLNKSEYKKLQKQYRTILTQGFKEMPEIPKKKTKGRTAKPQSHNLWERMKRYETSILLFSKVSEVPFTNNRAERDLRMNKVKQKVSGTFRSTLMAQAYCRITSYIKTRANQGINPMMALHEVTVLMKK